MTQAHDPKFPQASSGSLYPKNYVVGVIDDLQEAQRATEAFKSAGYDMNEIRLMDSGEALEKVQELDQEKNWLQSILSSFQDTTDETGAHIYQLEARRGNHILHVRADSRAEIDKISELMQQYHAHTIKFFGPWSVADIPPKGFKEHQG